MTEKDKADLTRIEDLSEYLHESDSETDSLLEGASEEALPGESAEWNNSPQNEGGEWDQEAAPGESAEWNDSPKNEGGEWDQEAAPGESAEWNEENGDSEWTDPPEGESPSEEPPGGSDAAAEGESGDSEWTDPPPDDGPVEEPPGRSDAAAEAESADSEWSRESETPPEGIDDAPPAPANEPAAAPFENSQPPPPPPEKKPARENFEDVRTFGQSIGYGTVANSGNPPFSLMLKGIRYREDIEDILIVLREHKLCHKDNEKILTDTLEHGGLLLSQINEYSAIYLAHRFRKYNATVQVGLSDELHPSKSYAHDQRGITSKRSFKQNVSESKHVAESIELEDILLATTPTMENHTIHNYLQVITAHRLVDQIQLEKNHQSPRESSPQNLNEIYQELAWELKNEALKLKANAVVGINYQITPLISNAPNAPAYKVTCIGSAVWVSLNAPQP